VVGPNRAVLARSFAVDDRSRVGGAGQLGAPEIIIVSGGFSLKLLRRPVLHHEEAACRKVRFAGAIRWRVLALYFDDQVIAASAVVRVEVLDDSSDVVGEDDFLCVLRLLGY